MRSAPSSSGGDRTASHWDLRVRGEEIARATGVFPFQANGFSIEMWEPLVSFVEANYPGDADVMYNDRTSYRGTPEALQLWEQHIADFVASESAE